MNPSNVEKLSVSIPGDVMSWVRVEAERTGASVSAVLASLAREKQQSAARQEAQTRTVLANLDELADHLRVARLTDADRERADEELRALGLL